MQVRFVPQEELDQQKWNSCVHFAPNGHIFGYRWFLDQTARHWDALVEDDYHSVMPLPYDQVFFRRPALQQPKLIRELAIYSVRALSPARVKAFWRAIPEQYRTIQLTIEPQSRPRLPEYQLSEVAEPFHFLDLSKPYETIAASFSDELKNQLQQAEAADLLPISSIKPERIAEFYRKQTRNTAREEWIFHGLQRIMYQVLHRGWGFASGLQNRQGELLAVAFFIYSHGKVMAFISVESAIGKKEHALALLLDYFIRSHAGRPLMLDFQAVPNDLAGSFGGYTEPRFHVTRDERPGWMKTIGALELSNLAG